MSLMTTMAFAQYEPIVNIQKLTDTLYKISASYDYDVNCVASVGEDGILLVDTGFKETTQQLQDALAALGKGAVKYIITTHAHVDHTGGHAFFGRDAVILGHEQVRTRFTMGGYILEEYPPHALPDIAITNEVSVFFNEEEIRIIPLPGSHSDTDMIVVFLESKVAYLGDLAYGNKFPSTSGRIGSAAEYAEVVRKANDYLPEGVTVVSGHGGNCTRQEMIAFQEMLEQTTTLVREGLAQGKDVATLQEENIFESWADSYGDYYVSANDWMAALAASIQPSDDNRKSMVEPLYHAYHEQGIDALIATYSDLRDNHSDEYQFTAGAYYNFGKHLMNKGRFDDAITFYGFFFNDTATTEIYTFGMGEAYMGKGENAKAIEYFKTVLQINPGQLDTVQILERLESKN
jgi:glyoxylase-like metal-dependent hydrolase (beta-lactamase superfamily II)